MSASSGSAGRWLLLVLMLGGSGWASFTLWERTTSAAGPVAVAADPKVEQLVSEGFKHLALDELDVAGEKLNKAAGAAPGEPRVHEGLVLIAVRRAERLWWQAQLDAANGAKHVEELDHAVHKAREVIAEARRGVTDSPTQNRIAMAERRLNTMLVVAFAGAGLGERARGALGARLATHPQRKLLEQYVGTGTPPPATSGSASASASAAASAPSPPPSGRVMNNPRPSGWGNNYEPHYELDHEPAMHDKPKTAGELQLPTTQPQPLQNIPAPDE